MQDNGKIGMVLLLKVPGLGILVFLALQTLTLKFESAIDGRDVLGFPFVFFARIGGKCRDCRGLVDFDWMVFLLDYLLSALFASLILQAFKKKGWIFGLLGMIICFPFLGNGLKYHGSLAEPSQANESHKTRPSLLSFHCSGSHDPIPGFTGNSDSYSGEIFQDTHHRIQSIKTLLVQFIEFQESTDSEENKKSMEEHLTSLKGIRNYSDFEVLLNVWLYYDPTDFPTRELIWPILKNSRPYSMNAIERRILNRKKWENKNSAPFSELKGLLMELQSAPG